MGGSYPEHEPPIILGRGLGRASGAQIASSILPLPGWFHLAIARPQGERIAGPRERTIEILESAFEIALKNFGLAAVAQCDDPARLASSARLRNDGSLGLAISSLSNPRLMGGGAAGVIVGDGDSRTGAAVLKKLITASFSWVGRWVIVGDGDSRDWGGGAEEDVMRKLLLGRSMSEEPDADGENGYSYHDANWYGGVKSSDAQRPSGAGARH
jgi:hypothetical protein